MTLPSEEAPANSVPAAAVIRRVQALIGITGRKGHAGGLECVDIWKNTKGEGSLLGKY